jgi:hypothetical protein
VLVKALCQRVHCPKSWVNESEFLTAPARLLPNIEFHELSCKFADHSKYICCWHSEYGSAKSVQNGQPFRDGYHISDSIFLQSIHMHTNHQRNIFFRFSVFPSLSAFNAYLKRLTKCSEQNHEGYHRQVQARLICCEASVCTCNIYKACVTCGKYSVYCHHTSLSLNSIRTHKALRNKY